MRAIAADSARIGRQGDRHTADESRRTRRRGDDRSRPHSAIRPVARIAPGMRADLCLFSIADASLFSSGSESFLRLFEAGSPDAVLIAGKFVGGDFDGPSDSHDKSAPPRPVKNRQAKPRELKQIVLPNRAFF